MSLSEFEITEKLKNRGLDAIMTTLLVALLFMTHLSYASDDINTYFIYDTNHSSLETDNPEDDHTNIVSPDFLFSISEQPQHLPLLRAVHELKSGFIKQYTPAYFIRAPPIYS